MKDVVADYKKAEGKEKEDLKDQLKTLTISKKKLEKELQKILDDTSREIAQGVSPNIKHPNEMGLINKH